MIFPEFITVGEPISIGVHGHGRHGGRAYRRGTDDHTEENDTPGGTTQRGHTCRTGASDSSATTNTATPKVRSTVRYTLLNF